jgi:hypothetical protein
MSESQNITAALIAKYSDLKPNAAALDPLIKQYMRGKLKAKGILAGIKSDMDLKTFAINLGKIAKVEKEAINAEPIYSHPNNKRCPYPNRMYPAFLEKVCGARMIKSRICGEHKYWECLSCGRTIRTDGELM